MRNIDRENHQNPGETMTMDIEIQETGMKSVIKGACDHIS